LRFRPVGRGRITIAHDCPSRPRHDEDENGTTTKMLTARSRHAFDRDHEDENGHVFVVVVGQRLWDRLTAYAAERHVSVSAALRELIAPALEHNDTIRRWHADGEHNAERRELANVTSILRRIPKH